LYHIISKTWNYFSLRSLLQDFHIHDSQLLHLQKLLLQAWDTEDPKFRKKIKSLGSLIGDFSVQLAQKNSETIRDPLKREKIPYESPAATTVGKSSSTFWKLYDTSIPDNVNLRKSVLIEESFKKKDLREVGVGTGRVDHEIRIFKIMNNQKTPFECLGIDASATYKQIITAYNKKYCESVRTNGQIDPQKKSMFRDVKRALIDEGDLRKRWAEYVKVTVEHVIFDRMHDFIESHDGETPFDCLDLKKNIHATEEKIEQTYSDKVKTLPDEASKTALKQARDELIGDDNIRDEWEEYATRLYNRPQGP